MDSTIEVERSPFIASIGSRGLPTLPASILDEVASYLRWEEASLLSTMHARNSKNAFTLAVEGREYEVPLQWKDRYALIPDAVAVFVSSFSHQRLTVRMALHQDPDSEVYTALRRNSGVAQPAGLPKSRQAIACSSIVCEFCHKGVFGFDTFAHHCKLKHKNVAEYRKRIFFKARETGILPLLPLLAKRTQIPFWPSCASTTRIPF